MTNTLITILDYIIKGIEHRFRDDLGIKKKA